MTDKKRHDGPRHNNTFHGGPFKDDDTFVLTSKGAEVLKAAQSRRRGIGGAR